MNCLTSLKALIAAAVLTGLSSTGVYAQDKLVSDALMPGDSDSKWLAGLTLGGLENPLAGEQGEGVGFANINLEYRGEKLFLAKDGLGYNLLRTGNISAGVLLSGKQSLLQDDEWYDDNELLAGLEQRDGTADFGIYMIQTTRLGQLRVRALEEISGQHKGHSVDATYIFNFKTNGWRINPFISVAYESAESTDYFFGVSEAESNGQRAAYEADAAVNVSAGINARYRVTQNWEIGAGASVTRLGEGISDSSLIDDDILYAASLTANYNF